MSASVVKRGEHRYAVVVEEGSQPARRCAARCKGGRVWANDEPDLEECPKCGDPLGQVAHERRQRWHGPYKRQKDAAAAADSPQRKASSPSTRHSSGSM